MPTNVKLREHLDERLEELKSLRQSWEPEWRDIARFQAPQRGEFFRTPNQGNRGVPKNQAILDTNTTFAIRTLKAGLMGGLTSPARPWFRLTVSDPRIAQITSVRAWLDGVAEGMMMIFADSNIYEVLLLMYEELGVFGTAAAVLEEDFEDVIRGYQMTIGQYWLALNHRGIVDTVYREIMMSARQCVQRWGAEAVGPRIAQAAKERGRDKDIAILHAIEPNADFEPGKLGAQGKRFRSVYWAKAGDPGHLISVRGYDRWPCLTPRWQTVSNDPWGTGPGHQSQPDVKSLQVLAKRRHNAVDKHVNPPMGAPVELQGKPSGVVPGHITYFPGNLTEKIMRPLYQTNPSAFQPLQALIQDTRDIISRTYYADLFLMITNMDGIQPRNQIEIIARKEEKLMMLGPVLDSLRSELLKPLVDWTFEGMVKHRLFGADQPPQEANGYPLDVELISVLAQAQKAARVGSIERLAAFTGGLVGVYPEVKAKINPMEMVDQYADSIGTPVGIVRGDDEAQKIIDGINQKLAAEKAVQTGQALVGGAKVLSETDVGGGRSALQAVTGV